MALWLYYGFINIPKGAFIAAGIGYKWKDDRNWYQMDFFFQINTFEINRILNFIVP